MNHDANKIDIEVSERLDKKTVVVKINRPDKYNALNAENKWAMTKLIKSYAERADINSIILSAAGKAFCTGQDLGDREIQVKENGGVDLGHTLESEWLPLIKAIRHSPKIIIAAINGVCAGAGISLALNCDIVLSAHDTKFVPAFLKLGLIPDAGLSKIITSHFGPKRAWDFFINETPITAQLLYQRGLINELNELPLESAFHYAETLSEFSLKSLSLLKSNVNQSVDLSTEEMWNKEVISQRYLGKTPQYAEGLSAFLEKRKPQF